MQPIQQPPIPEAFNFELMNQNSTKICKYIKESTFKLEKTNGKK